MKENTIQLDREFKNSIEKLEHKVIVHGITTNSRWLAEARRTGSFKEVKHISKDIPSEQSSPISHMKLDWSETTIRVMEEGA